MPRLPQFVFCLSAFAAVAAFPTAQAQDNGSAAELHRSLRAEPDTLDPQKASLKVSWGVLRDLYEGLTRADVNGNPVPGAAEGWETSEDGLTWTFHLRDNLHWSDGAPVTAEDFEAGFKRLFDPVTASKNTVFLDMIENAKMIVAGALPPDDLGVEAIDARTLTMKLESPAPQLPVLLSVSFAAPLPLHAADGDGEISFAPGAMISNGAYTLEDWELNAEIDLQRNENYWDANDVPIEHVVYYPVANENTALLRFRAGELDIVSWFGTPQHRWLEQNMPQTIHTTPGLYVTYLVFNDAEPPFDDVRLRKALSLSIDRRILTDNVLRIGDEPTFDFVPSGVSNYASLPREAERLSQAERVARAQTLLGEAGYGRDNPIRFEFSVRQGDDERRVGVAIQNMWRQIGVEAEINISDLRTHYANLEQGNFSVADAGWSVFDAPEFFLDLMQSETGAFNYGDYASEAFDTKLAEALATPDIDTRHALFAEAEAIMLDDQPVAPLYFNVTRYIVSEKVTGFVDNAADIHLSQYLSVSP